MCGNPKPIRRSHPQSELERQLITDYLKSKGYSRQDLLNLPEEEAYRLRFEACQYASLKLAEIESRAGFKHKIHYED
jgi:hypothetical protein